MKTTNFKIQWMTAPAVLALIGMAVAGATNVIQSGSRNRSASTLIQRQLSEDAKVEGIVAVTQTLVEERDGQRRDVRVVVHSLCITKRGSKPDWVTGQRTVAAAGREAAQTAVSVGGVACQFTVQPGPGLNWEQVASHHDMEVSFQP